MRKAKYYICLILLCIGCSTTKHYERDTYSYRKKVESLEKQTLSKQEILAKLGEPDLIKTNKEGKEIWVYWSQQLSSNNSKIADTYYNIIFNEDESMNKLTTHSYGYSFSKKYPEANNRPEYKLKKEQLGSINENRSVIMDIAYQIKL